jgi:hypothetical protein
VIAEVVNMKAAAEVLRHLFEPEVSAEHPNNQMTEGDWLDCATSIVNAALGTDKKQSVASERE